VRLNRAPLNFLQPQVIRLISQVLRYFSFREGAELALKVANIGVIDVAVTNETHTVTDYLRTQSISRVADSAEVIASRRKQSRNIGVTEGIGTGCLTPLQYCADR
jgi:hypothetical protein